MDFTPIDRSTGADDAVLTQTPESSFPGRPRLGPEVLRYRGLVMNTITGLILIHGRPAQLAVKERELLAALMRRAGQIVSPKWLAEQLHASVAEIEELTARLNAALHEAGASCLPRRVEGLGYILWR